MIYAIIFNCTFITISNLCHAYKLNTLYTKKYQLHFLSKYKEGNILINITKPEINGTPKATQTLGKTQVCEQVSGKGKPHLMWTYMYTCRVIKSYNIKLIIEHTKNNFLNASRHYIYIYIHTCLYRFKTEEMIFEVCFL